VTPRQLAAFLAMVFGMFMAILDIQIVSSSIGEIQAGLAASSDEISWIQTSYLIAEVVMIPLSGYLSRLMSTRMLFVVSSLGFTVFSLACAFAWNIESMIVFRAFQGFLGGEAHRLATRLAFRLFLAAGGVHRDLDAHLRVQHHADLGEPQSLDGYVENDLRPVDRQPPRRARLRHVAAGDGAVEAAALAGLADDDEALSVELLGDLRRLALQFEVARLELRALVLELLLVGFRGAQRLA